MIRAPISAILPSFIPVMLEKGVPGYNKAPCIRGETRLSLAEIRALLAAAIFFGALEHATNKNFDYDQVRQILLQSLTGVDELSQSEKALVLQLIERFQNFKIIRAEHSFDDWLCEAWWGQFQSTPYSYPSAMADAISYGLEVSRSLDKCSLEY